MIDRKCIMLVDDDESTNRFHEIVFNQLDAARKIIIAKNGKVGLEKLLSKTDIIKPDLIFIDLNMPVMGGFRFLELYQQTEEYKILRPKIVILTTSLIPEERSRILNNFEIFKFLNKPLTKSLIKDLLREIN